MQCSSKPGRPARIHFAMLTYGALEATQRCVRSLQATTTEPFQLFVVDNASTDGTQQWLRLRQEPWLHWRLNERNRGVPGGRNDLLEFALPRIGAQDWLVFIDNDLEFEDGWLEPFLAAIEAHPDARVFGKAGHFLQVGNDGRSLLPAPARTGPVDVVSGGFACFVRADAAVAIGRFDEQLGLFWHEDDDWCVRALQLGYGVVAVPEAAIVHHEHGSGAANDGLREGGSRRNQRYLVDKWRGSGFVDAGGFVTRRDGPYLPAPVREQLRQRMARELPIGRTELAQAMTLIDAMVDQPDPLAWFQANRRPVPDCTRALLDLQLEQAQAMAAPDLAAQLQRIRAVFDRANNHLLLRDLVRVPSPSAGGAHGICSARDLLDAEVRRIADEAGVGGMVRDPGTWQRWLWAELVVCRQIEASGIELRGARVAAFGSPAELIGTWLQARGAELERHDEPQAERLRGVAAVLFCMQIDPDTVADVLAQAPAGALVLFVGDVTLNGVPSPDVPQPFQLANDLLERAGLAPVGPIRTAVDDIVLECCADHPDRQHQRPALSQLRGQQLLTSFVVAARRAPRPGDKVIQPAAPRNPAPVTVGLDLRTLFQADSTSRGIGHYTVQHLAALARRAPELRLVGYTLRGNDRLPGALAQAPILIRAIDDYSPTDVDLVHLPDPMNGSIGFDSPLRVLRHERTTITFHDLTPLRHYVRDWPRRNREAYLDRLQQIRSGNAHLLCNSRFTADDVQQELQLDPVRVTPILAGLNGRNRRQAPGAAQIEAVLAQFGIEPPFVLHVGAHDPHKNFLNVLSAFLQVRAHRPLQLVVAGAVDPGIAGAANLCQRKRVPDVVFTGYLPRLHLDCLYAAATALISLSRAEGFGFPLLEAMAAGCPVVASNVTSHPEVVGDAGMLVAPDDPASAAAAIEALLVDRVHGDNLRERGQVQAQKFTWDAVADRTLAVWRRLLSRVQAPARLTVAQAWEAQRQRV